MRQIWENRLKEPECLAARSLAYASDSDKR
jgi:hypothetical protein